MTARSGILTVTSLLAGLIPLTPEAGVAQDRKTIALRLEDSTLTVTNATLPRIAGGQRLVVEVRGDSIAVGLVSDWSFTLDGQPLDRVVQEEVLVAYSITVPEVEAATAALAFEDASRRVEFAPGAIELVREETTGTESGRNRVETRAVRLRGVVEGRRRLYDRARNEVNLYFTESGLPDARGLPRDVDDNDVINVYLAVPADADVGEFDVQVSGRIRDQDISVLGEGMLAETPVGVIQGTGGAPDLEVHALGAYGPFSPPSVTITITRTRGDQELVNRSHTLRINRTYVASLRFGVGESNIRFNEFAVVRSPDRDTTTVQNRSSAEGELRSFLLVTFYGWHFWDNRFWNGRDIEETPTFLDRINPTVGIGLDDLGEEFLAGASLEVARGLDAYVAWHFARTRVLTRGVDEGDAFAGTTGELPTQEDWEDDVIFGASVDLRIATTVLGSLLGGGS